MQFDVIASGSRLNKSWLDASKKKYSGKSMIVSFIPRMALKRGHLAEVLKNVLAGDGFKQSLNNYET